MFVRNLLFRKLNEAPSLEIEKFSSSAVSNLTLTSLYIS
jgi:hypothetical protein